MTGAELAPFELAGRLALAFGPAAFLGLAFEEMEQAAGALESRWGTNISDAHPLRCDALLDLEPQHALAFTVGGYSHWQYGSTPICAMRCSAPMKLA